MDKYCDSYIPQTFVCGGIIKYWPDNIDNCYYLDSFENLDYQVNNGILTLIKVCSFTFYDFYTSIFPTGTHTLPEMCC